MPSTVSICYGGHTTKMVSLTTEAVMIIKMVITRHFYGLFICVYLAYGVTAGDIVLRAISSWADTTNYCHDLASIDSHITLSATYYRRYRATIIITVTGGGQGIVKLLMINNLSME